MKKSAKRKALICALALSLSLSVSGLFACGEGKKEEAEPKQNNVCSHVWLGEAITVAPTCETEGSATQTCMKCGEKDTYVKPALGHSFETVQGDQNEHWGKCTICGDEEAKEAHNFVWEFDDEIHTNKCDVCNWIKTEGNHSGSDNYLDDGVNHYLYCDVCENAYSIGEHEIESTYTDDEHIEKCLDCQLELLREPHSLSWDWDEEGHKEVCSGCEYVANEGVHSGSDEWQKNSIVHYHHCDVCANDYAEEEHSYNGSMICDECAYGYQSTGLSYKLINNGTAYMVMGIGTETGTVLGIPETHEGLPVVSIGQNAFTGNSEIQSVIIPKSVTRIEQNAFTGVTSLNKVSFGGSVTDWASIDFVTVGSNPLSNKAELYAMGERVENADLSSVPTIRAFVFNGCTSIENVTAGNVSSIGNSAFRNCINLKSVTVSNAGSIENYAFKGCENLTSFVVPANVSLIGEEAFASCVKMKTFTFRGNNVWSIGTEAFKDNESLVSISIPASVEIIGQNAFENCYALKTATFASNVKMEIVAKELFKNCNSLESATLSGAIEYIEESAFFGCTSLKTIVLSANLSSVAENAFKNCSNVDVVRFDGVLSAWFKIDFANKESNPLHATADLYNANGKITELSLPENCSEIKKYALINCTSIEKIIANSTLSIIGKEAMSGCINLKSVSTTGSNVRTISEMAFYGCEKLSEISWSDKIETIGIEAFNGCALLKEINLKDANKLTAIGSRAFKGCLSVTEVYLPKNLSSIGEDAFHGLSKVNDVYYSSNVEGWTNIEFATEASNPMYKGANLYFKGSKVTYLSIGDSYSAISVTVIKANTFVGCESLTHLYITGTVSRVEFGAFKGCKNIKVLSTNFIGEEMDGIQNNHFGYIFGAPTYADNKKFVPTYIETLTIVEGMKTFANYAFYGCDGIGTIVIPTSIDSFGLGAFEKTDVTNVLYNDSMVDGSRAWARKTFANETANPLYTGANLCWNHNVENVVKTIQITKGTLYINSFAFVGSNIERVETIDYDSYVFDGIGESAFKNCNSLKYFDVPFIGDKVSMDRPFGYLFGAKTAEENGSVVPASLKTVKVDYFENLVEKQFYNCRHIEELWLGEIDNVEIGRDAFYGCSSISMVVFNGGSEKMWAQFQFPNKYANPLHPGAGLYTSTSVSGPAPVTEVRSSYGAIGKYSFYGCTTLNTVFITNNGTDLTVGESAFENCSGLETVTLYNGKTDDSTYFTFEQNVFKNCPSIEKVNYCGEFINEWFNIDFKNEYSNPLINGVPLYYGSGTSEVLVTAFDMTETDVTVLENNILAGCTSLEYINLKGLTGIEQGALYGCTNLKSVLLPYLGGFEGDTENAHIGYVFGATDANENAKFVPELLKEVGVYSCSEITANAFKGASKIQVLHLPGNKLTFREGAFEGCNIKEVYYVIEGRTTLNFVRENWANSTFESFDSNPLHSGASLTVGNTELVNGAENRALVSQLRLDYEMYNVNPYAFAGCGSITSIYFSDPDTNSSVVRTVGDYAFKNCFALEEIYGYKQNMTFGFGSLEGTSLSYIRLTKIGSADGENTHIGYIFGAETYLENATKLPASLKSIGYYGTESIDDYAFYGAKYVKAIDISASVAEIGASAFENCTALTEVIIWPTYTGQTMNEFKFVKIGESAFANCKSLASVTIPESLESTGYGAFIGCRSIRTVHLLGEGDLAKWATISFGYNGNPLESGAILKVGGMNFVKVESVENADITLTGDQDTISAYAFKGCSSITSVSLTGVKHIGDEAFASCSKLKSVVVADKELTSIGIDAFYKCTALEEINLGDTNLAVISERAFGGCVVLKEITIPATVTYMGENVFSGNDALTVTVKLASKPDAWEDSFANGVKEVVWEG